MKNDRPNLKLVYGIIIFLTLIAIAIVIRRTYKLVPVLINGFHAHVTQSNPALEQLAKTDDIFARYPILTLLHIMIGLIFLLLAPFQFSKNIRIKNISCHRIAGKIVLVCGLLTGLNAFIMSIAMPSIGGVNQATATTLFSVFFLFALCKAYQYIRRRKIALHREWMIRAYAIGLAIATI